MRYTIELWGFYPDFDDSELPFVLLLPDPSPHTTRLGIRPNVAWGMASEQWGASVAFGIAWVMTGLFLAI